MSVPIDPADLASVLVTAAIIDPESDSLIRGLCALCAADGTVANRALNDVAEICGRDTAVALLQAVEDEFASNERRLAAARAGGVNGVEYMA